MKLRTFALVLSGILLIAGLSGIALEQRAISKVRAENRQLQSNRLLVESLSNQNSTIADLQTNQKEVARLRIENREIHKLRNEVRQLREQAKQFPALQLENKRLRAANSNPAISATINTPQPDFLRPEQLSFAGYSTPEATFQTMIWSLSQGDVEKLLNCFPAEAKEMAEKVRSEGVERMKEEFSRFKGYRVVARRATSDQEMQLGLQLHVEGGREENQEVALPFRLIGSEWKIAGGF
jgi:hypothetical protein